MTPVPRLELAGLNKRFGDIQVLQDIDLAILPGEIHGLAGQNGSGKSTLIKILTGVYTPDSGAVLKIDGRPMRLPVRWAEVHRAGVSVVHQDLGILDELTVAENICVGGFPQKRWLRSIDRRRRDDLCAATLARLGSALAPSMVTAELSAAARAEVALARAMRDHMTGEGLLILDETTRALSGDEREHVHDLIRRISSEGTSVLMISHNLVELASIANSVSILRDGRMVASALPMPEAGPEEIARYMLGRNLAVKPVEETHRNATDTPILARVTGLSSERVGPISFTLRAGEILGITGITGSGYEDIPYFMTGARHARGGILEVEGAKLDLTRCQPAECIRSGVVLIPERRDRDGLALEMSVRDNMCLPALRRHSSRWFLGRRWQQESFVRFTTALDIKTSGPTTLVRELSGGNQQKALLAKWLGLRPKVLVLHEPTQAVDVRARQDIWMILEQVARDGMGIIVVSSEPEDLTSICTRVMICAPDGRLEEARDRTPGALIDQIYASRERAVI